MRPWFRNDERRAALWAEQQSWLGTPFFARNCEKGVGVDCVRLQLAMFAQIGAVEPMALPDYTLDHGKHVAKSQLLSFLLTAPQLAGRLVMVPLLGRRLVGDLIAVQSGLVDHHLASVNPYDEIVHAVEDVGVIRTKLNDELLRRRILYVLRLMEVDA